MGATEGMASGSSGRAAASWTTRVARCRCGGLRIACRGEPVRVSVCHCLDCQVRSGSAFAAQARWPDAQVRIQGEWTAWTAAGDSGARATFRFCPTCGATVSYASEAVPGFTSVPVGAFADPGFPAPRFSVYEERRHPWVAVTGEQVEHID